MATNENLIPIPGRLHSVATEGHVAGADEIYDDTLQKDQATINQEVNAALGEGGTVDEKIAEAIDDALEDVAFIDDSESSPAVVPGFDPTTDTVHVTAQTLSESQKAQVRNNIGLGDVDAKINEAVASEASQRAAAVSGVQSSVNAETSRAQAKENLLQNNIKALTQSNIAVVADHTSVSSPDPLTIYREQGTNTYSDWMYQNGSWNKMAEYDNAIDDVPTTGSENLVKSGGVASLLSKSLEIILYEDNKYCYIYEGKLLPQGSGGADFRLEYVDVSAYVGKEIHINCVSNSQDNPYHTYHLFTDDDWNVIGNYIEIKPSQNPQNVTVPTGATKLWLSCYEPESLNTQSVSVVVSIGEAMEMVKDEVNDLSLNLLIDWVKDGAYYSVADGKVLPPQTSGGADHKAGVVDVQNNIGKTIIINCASKAEDNPYLVCHAFANDDNDLIGSAMALKPSQIPFTTTIPEGATKLYITCYKPVSGSNASVTLLTDIQDAFDNVNRDVEDIQEQIKGNVSYNQWSGKKILWLGTSIPWGQSDEDDPGTTSRVAHPYPQQVCNALGATLIDSTHGGLAQQAYYDPVNNQWCPRPYEQGQFYTGGSTSLTIAECRAAVSLGWPNCEQYSYENTLLGKNADLYVFDVEPNNDADGSADDLALFDWRLWKYTDDSSFASHRGSYIGALIYEIDQLLTEKPDAIIVFVGEHVNMKLSNYTTPFEMRPPTIAFCEKFHIHYINLAEKLFYVGKNASQWINTDMVHPKKAAYDRMARMLIHELLLIA